jgi:serine phosphatase RsbU (regulator of sigma subunit)
MDIALCAFDKRLTPNGSYQVEYTGANRPLWIIRNSSPNQTAEPLEEIKATKRGIGRYTKDEQEFIKHTIELQKGDTIYITSDGYADQFSPSDKKIMTRVLKEMLVSIQSKSMEEQKNYLDSFVEDWKGGLEQTDDILIIGIRI